MKIVKIIWMDTISTDGWFSNEEALKWVKDDIGEIHDVGYLLEKNKDYVVISPSYSYKVNQYDYLKKIPTKVIKKIITIK